MPLNRDAIDVISTRREYDGYFKLDVYRLRHRLHRGGWSAVIEREVLEHGHAVGVVPYDPVRDRVVLIEQIRVPTLGAGSVAPALPNWLIEVVAGIVGDGESPEDVARRETREEAGLTVGALEAISRYYASPGCTSETLMLYCGRVDAGHVPDHAGLAEENEDIRPFSVCAEEAFSMVEDGRICNSCALIGLLWLRLNRERLRRQWV